MAPRFRERTVLAEDLSYPPLPTPGDSCSRNPSSQTPGALFWTLQVLAWACPHTPNEFKTFFFKTRPHYKALAFPELIV